MFIIGYNRPDFRAPVTSEAAARVASGDVRSGGACPSQSSRYSYALAVSQTAHTVNINLHHLNLYITVACQLHDVIGGNFERIANLYCSNIVFQLQLAMECERASVEPVYRPGGIK